jgi:hypothetical protein
MMDDGGIPSFAKWNDGPRVGSDLMLTLQAIPHNPAGGIVEGRSDRTACWTGLDWTGLVLFCGPVARGNITFQSQCPEHM